MARLLASRFVEQRELGVAVHDDWNAGRVHDHGAVLDPHLGIERRFDRGLLGAALHRTADMEGAHRQLRARLADRLRRNDADGLADVDDRAARKIAAVALAAKADARLAGQHRADEHRIDAGAVDEIDLGFADEIAGGDDHLAAERIEHVDRRGSAEDAIGQRRDHLAALDHGAHRETALRAAILFGDDRVLRDVDESARPLRAPCVELKYSSTVNPSLKFEMIGVSMISPEGFAIRPRMPASCLICAAEPRAPLSAIIHTGLIASPLRGVRIAFIISSATRSVQFDHTSTTLLYFSPWVMRPSRYCCSYSLTFCCASLISFSLACGTMRSSLPKEMPALQACWKPIAIRRSQKITVSFWPQ